MELKEKRRKIRDLIVYEFGIMAKQVEMTQYKIIVTFDSQDLEIAGLSKKEIDRLKNYVVENVGKLLDREVEIVIAGEITV